MHLRLRFGLAGAIVLGVMLIAGVCAGKPAEPAKADVSGKVAVINAVVTWPGNLGAHKLDMTITPFPASAQKPMKHSIDTTPKQSLPAAQQAMLTSAAGIGIALPGDGVTAYVVKVAPPPGWQVTPKEYRATKMVSRADIKNVMAKGIKDNEEINSVRFTVEKAPESSRKNYWLIGISAFGAVILVVLGLAFSRRAKSKKDTRVVQ